MKNLFFVPLFALVLIGAGCAQKPAPAPTPEKPAPTAKSPVIPSGAEGSSQTPSAESPKVLTPAQTDDTWKTYTNAALGFSFMWPTKGRYAPEWEVKIYPAPKPIDAGDCFVPTDQYLGTNDIEESHRQFSVSGKIGCHSQSMGRSEIGVVFYDIYTINLGINTAAIYFNKKAYYPVTARCPENTLEDDEHYSALLNSCAAITATTYRETLDGIIGTFKMNQ